MVEPARKPLSRVPRKYRARTVKMTDEQYERFTSAALAEGDLNISGFIRSCAFIGLEYRERDRVFSAHRGGTGNTARAAGNTRGITAG